jgi:hypothetical protein
MHGCALHLFCSRCAVQTAALQQADLPSKESYRLSVRVIISELIKNCNMPESVIRQARRIRRSTVKHSISLFIECRSVSGI